MQGGGGQRLVDRDHIGTCSIPLVSPTRHFLNMNYSICLGCFGVEVVRGDMTDERSRGRGTKNLGKGQERTSV